MCIRVSVSVPHISAQSLSQLSSDLQYTIGLLTLLTALPFRVARERVQRRLFAPFDIAFLDFTSALGHFNACQRWFNCWAGVAPGKDVIPAEYLITSTLER